MIFNYRNKKAQTKAYGESSYPLIVEILAISGESMYL